MKSYENIKYDILKYVNDHIKINKMLLMRSILEEVGEPEFLENSRDLGKKLEKDGVIDTVGVSGGRVGGNRNNF